MKPKLLFAVAKAIKSLRIERKFSQEELAHHCGLDRTYISGIERFIRNPTLSSVSKIISAFEITEVEFLQQVIRELQGE